MKPDKYVSFFDHLNVVQNNQQIQMQNQPNQVIQPNLANNQPQMPVYSADKNNNPGINLILSGLNKIKSSLKFY